MIDKAQALASNTLPSMNTQANIDALLAIMARLRDPEHGCPWDLQQSFASVAPYTLEEAHEVVDAIEHGNSDDLRDELGDLLFQVVLQARIGEEQGLFNFDDVAGAISAKLVRRHPHVFGDVRYADAEQQARAWEAIKAQERGNDREDSSALVGVARGLSAEQRAVKLQTRAARTGFEWTDAGAILDKLAEELDEVRAEFSAGPVDVERAEDEIGDMLFVLANLTRHAQLDFARALRRANTKFERRFRCMEQLARDDGRDFAALTLAEQEALWQRAKAIEAAS